MTFRNSNRVSLNYTVMPAPHMPRDWRLSDMETTVELERKRPLFHLENDRHNIIQFIQTADVDIRYSSKLVPCKYCMY